MDQCAPEAMTFGVTLRALAELKGLDPALGDCLRLYFGSEELDPAQAGKSDRLCALLVVAERGGELPPGLVSAARDKLRGTRCLVALSSCDPGSGSAARAPAQAVPDAVLRDFRARLQPESSLHPAPPLAGSGRAQLDLTIPSDEALIPGLSHMVGLLLHEFGYEPDDCVSTIPLVIDEALTNAMRHGNRSCREKSVRVGIEIDARQFRLTVSDEGEGFRRGDVADPRGGDRIWKTGGRGLFLIEQLMDEVQYRDGGRTVAIVRYRRGGGPAVGPQVVPSGASSAK